MQQARLSYAPDQHWNPLVLDTRGNPEVRAVSRWRAGGFPVHSPAWRGGMGDTAAAGAEAAIQGAAQGFAQGGPIGAAIGAVTDLIGSLLTTSLTGKQKQSTTAIANDAEVLMQQNLSAYLASPRSQADQAAALQNYDQLWNWLVTNCATPSLADAGVACVDDRQRGACKWDKPAGSWAQDGTGAWNWTPAGAAGGGVCWNWFVGYRDPIANDPGVVPNEVASASVTGSSSMTLTDGTVVTTTPSGSTVSSPGGTSIDITPVLIGAGALVFLALMLPGGNS